MGDAHAHAGAAAFEGRMDISGSGFWDLLVAAAADDADLCGKAAHARACAFAVRIDDAQHLLEFHRGVLARLEGKDLTGIRFSISGPRSEWEKVITGAIPYARAINVFHGRLRVEGDALSVLWMTPALWQLWRVSARLSGGIGHD
ncbi:hypothetical protein V5G24_06655 [Xanthobacter sp. VTT E-85241]|jgi:putative sterol carrier protein|uniref:hypothetical protein n=1 Tax=Roseixanthobacter finlandensis TaxID=3119922 RepID=UPI00372B04B5